MSMAFHHFSMPAEAGSPPSALPSPYTISVGPDTDIWKKPPEHKAFNAPICYQKLKLSSLRSVQVRISAEWKTLFDQGGLCLVMPSKDAEQRWVKTGIEMFNGKPYVSTVACDRWADWSLWPLSGNSVTIEMQREMRDGKPTSTLWINILEGENRQPVREITWVFEPGREDEECWVGVFAAKPSKEAGNLEVRFDAFQLETV